MIYKELGLFAFIEIVKEYEIQLTLGSDAHDPNDVGKGFEVAYQLIQIYGGGKVSVFEGRERGRR